MNNSFRKDLSVLINSYSKENDSNTPDWILADFLIGCLEQFNAAIVARDKWYLGKSLRPGQPDLKALLGLALAQLSDLEEEWDEESLHLEMLDEDQVQRFHDQVEQLHNLQERIREALK